ncbi:Pr6Pr family membrane protein [Cellulomonas sp. 179-A 9B4 NHS]|uniref:Pr6Pr family membrane protein n=1 Tax=Cellulomonas sp. 179-A 9B4 NHS TaxID=3142379 RepID=UPI0039A153F7
MPAADPPRRPSAAVAAARVLVGVLALAVLGSSYAGQRAAGRGALVDFLGYFTNLTSLLAAVLLVAVGGPTLAGRAVPVALTTARGVATACLLVVAVVYNAVLPGDGGAAPWVSAVLHGVLPVLVLLDWLLVADRPPLPWRRLWLVLPYPVLWLAVVLLRGATDGWVPYGFLLPEHGTRSLALHVAGLLVVLLAAGALVWGISRTRGVRRLGAPSAPTGRGSAPGGHGSPSADHGSAPTGREPASTGHRPVG